MTSETASHTPGPWPITRTGDGKRYVIGEGLVEGPNGYEVAEVYSDDCDPDEAAANARLIAASPDLLKAAKRALSTFRAQGVHRDGNNVVAALEDAIALATQSKGA